MNKGTKFALKTSATMLAVACPLVALSYSILFPERTLFGVALAIFFGIVYFFGLVVGYNKGRRDALEDQKADEEDALKEEHK